MRFYLIISLSIIVSGCAAYYVPLENATFITKGSEIYAHCTTMNLRDSNPNLIIIRDEGFFGTTYPHVIYIDDEPCADLMPGEKLSLRLTPGIYSIGVKSKWDPYKIGRFIGNVIDLDNNKTSIVRYGVDTNGIRNIYLSPE
jgi:hypothetical protein